MKFLDVLSRKIHKATTMSESDYDRRLKDLDQALNEQDSKRKKKSVKERNNFSLTSKILSELLSGVFIGLFFGSKLDEYFETEPFLIITLTLLGFTGGMWNIYKTLEDK